MASSVFIFEPGHKNGRDKNTGSQRGDNFCTERKHLYDMKGSVFYDRITRKKHDIFVQYNFVYI